MALPDLGAARLPEPNREWHPGDPAQPILNRGPGAGAARGEPIRFSLFPPFSCVWRTGWHGTPSWFWGLLGDHWRRPWRARVGLSAERSPASAEPRYCAGDVAGERGDRQGVLPALRGRRSRRVARVLRSGRGVGHLRERLALGRRPSWPRRVCEQFFRDWLGTWSDYRSRIQRIPRCRGFGRGRLSPRWHGPAERD